MFVFVCAGCGAELTDRLARVDLPVHAHQKYGNGLQLPVLMEAGTFAVDSPEPWEPLRPKGDVPGSIVIAPGDARGTVLVPERAGGYCCGLDALDGPNMACEACGRLVACRIDDCSLWQAVWFGLDAVRPVPVDGDGVEPPLSWAGLLADGQGTPPFEPIAGWGSRMGTRYWWSWSPRWEAAAGRALAHLLAGSQGRPVRVPGGLTAEVFQRALDALLPSGPPVRRAALAGPGLPGADADLLLVPTHPQTGEVWTPPDASASLVPLPFGVWRWLAFPEPHLPVPASGGLPAGVLRDDPPAPRASHLFRMDPDVFRRTLAGLPQAGDPWLREILENLTDHVRAGLF
ncbi:hypothetical protein VM98_26575 [Streptomyces rubellomurinus subsp. indigoferus]|nr:hypothetical protein VM98_26575 [Streptomyces rubellomurinus subsp. indigoferus]